MKKNKQFFIAKPLIAFLIIAICVVIVTRFYVSDSKKQINQEIHSQLGASAQQSKQAILQISDENMNILEKYGENVLNNYEKSLIPIMFLDENYNFSIPMIIPINTRNRIYETAFISDTAMGKAALGKRACEFISLPNGEFVALYVVPMKDDSGNIESILSARRNVDDFLRVLKLSSVANNGYSFLFNNSGETICENDQKIKSLVDISFDNSKILHKTSYQDINYVIFSVPTGLDDWNIAVASKDYSFAIIEQRIKNVIVFILVAFTVLFILFTMYVKKSKYRYPADIESTLMSDPITGINSWSKFVAQYHNVVSNYNAQYAAVLMDIDKFKLINDMHGYYYGNQTLQEIANVLKQTQQEDELFARVSADNFIFLIRYNGDDDQITKRILSIVTLVNQCKQLPNVVLSFGIYKIDDRNLDVVSVSDRAGLAKNKIKGNHESLYCFYDQNMMHTLMEENDIESDMDAGISQKQFKIFIQPKYMFSNNKMAGGEVLVRWFHPVKGMISPAAFIPLFERNGFIRKMDTYIFTEVCEFISNWEKSNEKPFPVILSVNISLAYLDKVMFVPSILKITESYGINPNILEIEITEGTLYDKVDELVGIIKQLKHAGFKVSMDDFGTGFSSLNSLKNFDIDVLKFDKGFLEESIEDQRGKNIIRHLVKMAQSLDLTTVAEGVETEIQVEFLKDAGFDIAQGYYFAKPMNTDDFLKLLESST